MRNEPLPGLDAAYRSRDPAPEWTLADWIQVFFRRRGWLLGSVAAFLGLALLYWSCATPRYRASAEIEVQSHSLGAFGLDNAMADQPSSDVNDSFEANLNLQTEMAVLQSDALALEVIRRTGLEATPDYFAPRPSRLSWFPRVSFGRRPLEPLTVPLAEAPNRRYVALRIFSGRRRITSVAGTRLIAVAYSDPDPARAAQVANTLIACLAGYGYQSRSAAATESASWLAAQLSQLKKQTEALDERAASLDREAGSLGDDDAHNVILTRLDELNTALSAAESSRMMRESIWRAVQNGDPEVISGLNGNPAAGAGTQTSFTLLQSLRGQEATAKAQLAESASRYGENWPAVAEQRARLAALQKAIQDEVRRLGERARNDYEISLQAEKSAHAAYEQQRDLAAQMTGHAVSLRLARAEAGESRALYASLLGRLQQAGVLEGLHSGNFTVVTPAMVPPPDHPSSPSLPLLLAVALVGGIGTGTTAAMARELTDDRVRSAEELETLLEAPVFATLPQGEAERAWYRRLLPSRSMALATLRAAADSETTTAKSLLTERLHRLRASLLLSHSEEAPQVILITPAADTRPGAMKSGPFPRISAAPSSSDQLGRKPSPAFGLAAVLAQHGAATLYVNADLRTGPPAGIFAGEPGLSEMLSGGHFREIQDLPGEAPLLSVIPSGARPPCPPELIASRRMNSLLAEWRQRFAFIVVDGPAAVYADALVLAQSADAVLLSVTAGKSRGSEVVSAFHWLSRQASDRAVLGLVLEGVPYGHA